MTSPSLVISTGSFFSGVIFEYSSLAVPGATVEGMNSILSISPSSIAAMRTLRANGEAGENDSFMEYPLAILPGTTSFADAARKTSRGDDLLPLLAKPLDPERDHITDIEELRGLHA